MYIFHEDAGHGWVEVERSELSRLGILGQISCCSSQQGTKVFLEEDCDAAAFCKAKEAKGEKVEFRFVDDGNLSPIRRYARFSPRG